MYLLAAHQAADSSKGILLFAVWSDITGEAPTSLSNQSSAIHICCLMTAIGKSQERYALQLHKEIWGHRLRVFQ